MKVDVGLISLACSHIDAHLADLYVHLPFSLTSNQSDACFPSGMAVIFAEAPEDVKEDVEPPGPFSLHLCSSERSVLTF